MPLNHFPGRRNSRVRCGTKGCHGHAVRLAFWPGQPLPMCGPCLGRAQEVARAMGFVLESASLEDGSVDMGKYYRLLDVNDAVERLGGQIPPPGGKK